MVPPKVTPQLPKPEIMSLLMEDMCHSVKEDAKLLVKEQSKPDERGIVIRNKARLVAQGHTQEEGIDYDEVFLPVARIEAIRLLAYASFMGFTVYQMDAKSAFLYGPIDEEFYVMQPLGFQDPEFPARVYKVEKAMYGLHQALRAWYGTLSKYLLTNGFQRAIIDQTLFIRREFEALMHEKFRMSTMGELNFFLCLQVLQKKDGIFLSQDKATPRLILMTKSKPDERGIVIRNEARLVAQGNTQEEGIDYDEVFSPVARIEAIKLFLAYASYMGFTVYQMDAKSAFLYGPIDEEVYVMQPLGFQDPAFLARVYKVEKAMYGLHQALGAWYGTSKYWGVLRILMIRLGLIPLIVDFVEASHLRYALTIYPAVYVSHIRQFWSTARIETTDEGTKILAIVDGKLRTISESSIKRNLKLRDEAGISSLPDAELFKNLTLMGYNILPNQKFTFQKGQFSHQWKYLIHTIMQCLSPKSTGFNEFGINIATALVCLATNRVHPKLGLWYPKASSFDLVAYSDSDYGGASQDRKSTIGGSQFLGRRLISWQCKKQTIVATSTTEAEYIAATVVKFCRFRISCLIMGTNEAAGQDMKKDVSSLRYIALPNWFHEAHLKSSTSNVQDTCNADVPEGSGNSNPTATSTNPPADHMETLAVETRVPTVSSPISTACFDDSPQLSSDSRLISKRVTSQDNTPSLDNILTLTNRFEDILGVTIHSDESNGVEADISDALKDPRWVEAMQEELFQFKIQNVWSLVDCPKGVRPIGTKWVLKNKKDERRIMIRNKARLVAQGHTQEEGIDYDEVEHAMRGSVSGNYIIYTAILSYFVLG
nr:putative ribonuclease H-like domain-containing protein [Tanacetum cinerariifolium]